MSLKQRTAVLHHYSRGTKGSKWRNLPNFYAATLPRSLAAYVPPKPRQQKPVCGSSYDWPIKPTPPFPRLWTTRPVGAPHPPALSDYA
jgi:hypothetical protein